MTLKEFCNVYGGFYMNLYIPPNTEINVTSIRQYHRAMKSYGNYRVVYFDIYAYYDGDYSLNITIKND